MNKASPPPVIRRAMMAARVFYDLIEEKAGTDAGQLLRFPRNLETLITDYLEIPIIRQTNLTLDSANQYLCVQRNEQEPDRSLKGLFHVGKPISAIFIEERLTRYEQNYIIAHELAHFIHDVYMVRQLWLSTLEQQKAAIMQAFSWQKLDPLLELQAFVKGLPARPRAITKRSKGLHPATLQREKCANAIALEFLAPWKEAAKLFQLLPGQALIKELQSRYGLPYEVATEYAYLLQSVLKPQPDFFERLFKPLLDNNAS